MQDRVYAKKGLNLNVEAVGGKGGDLNVFAREAFKRPGVDWYQPKNLQLKKQKKDQKKEYTYSLIQCINFIVSFHGFIMLQRWKVFKNK